MEKKKTFQSELVYDLPKYKEFTKLNLRAHGRTTFLYVIVILCNLYLISGLDSRFTARVLFLLSVFWLVMRLIRFLRNRSGGREYKRFLRSNNGQVPHQILTVDENGIHAQSAGTDRVIHESFDDIRFLMESENLLVIVDELKMCQILDKTTLTGGTREELVAYLRENCPKLKKRIRTGKPGKIADIILLGVVLLALVASLAVILRIPARLTGQITNDQSYEQMSRELTAVDIHIDPATIEEMKAYEPETSDLLGFLLDDYPRVLNLLCWEGMGKYDSQTLEWTPSSSGVYWFDLEAMNEATMYMDFLDGISAMDDSLTFSNVFQDLSQINQESGVGQVYFSFDYGGEHHELEASYSYDWFDTDILYDVGRILAADQDPQDLWMTSDGGQGLLLYYGTEEEKSALERKTGLNFLDCVIMRMGH